MKKIRVIVACEESQAVCKAFRERGFEAFSCDIEPCSGGHLVILIFGYIICRSCILFMLLS